MTFVELDLVTMGLGLGLKFNPNPTKLIQRLGGAEVRSTPQPHLLSLKDLNQSMCVGWGWIGLVRVVISDLGKSFINVY
jgi:hypothetical protein